MTKGKTNYIEPIFRWIENKRKCYLYQNKTKQALLSYDGHSYVAIVKGAYLPVPYKYNELGAYLYIGFDKDKAIKAIIEFLEEQE